MRVAQCGGGVDRAEDIAARRLDVALERFDLRAPSRRRRSRRAASPRRRSRSCSARPARSRRSSSSRALRFAARRPARRAPAASSVMRVPSIVNLLRVELDLLLGARDLELVRVRALARSRSRARRPRRLDAQRARARSRLRRRRPPRIRARARRRAARAPTRSPARARDTCARRALSPSAALVAQPLVTPRLRGLPLQAAALLLDFEHDVVDAREVLLRGFELEFGGAAARLVFRDARGLFDQLPAIGGPRRGSGRSCPAR